MTDLRTAAVFTAFGFLLASHAGQLQAAPDKTPGMALLSARVGGNGNLAGGAGAVSATKVGPQGQYKVTFKRDLSEACVVTATINGAGPNGEQGFIVAEIASNGAALVRTYDADKTFEDRTFSAIVFCVG